MVEYREIETVLIHHQLLVLEWRNHRKIRKWMNNTGLISQGEHLNYIEMLRSDRSIQAYLGYERDTPIGVLNINGSKNIEMPDIGLYVNPDKMHSGFGIKLAFFGGRFPFDTKGYNSLRFQANPEHEEVIKLWSILGVEGCKMEIGEVDRIHGTLNKQTFESWPNSYREFLMQRMHKTKHLNETL